MSEKFRSVLEETINADGVIAIKGEGNSMKPFILPQRDILIIEKIKYPIKKNDIVLFYYQDKIFLHRVVSVHDGMIDTRGDHNCTIEKGIRYDDIFGKLKAVQRKEHEININSFFYVTLAKLWSLTVLIRRMKRKICRG